MITPSQTADQEVSCRTPTIVREHLLDTIDDLVQSSPHAVVLEGENGDGKSTLASNFSARHSNRAVFVTISAASKWGYDPQSVLQLIGSELHRVLNISNTTSDYIFQESDLHPLYARLRRRTTLNEPFLFIFDGLHEIPDDDSHLRERIIALVPLGINNCVAVFTDSVPSKVSLPAQAKIKTWRLPKFSLEESREYLHGIVTDNQSVAEIHRTFKGRPGSLAVVRRLLLNGATAGEFLKGTDGALESLLEREWSCAAPFTETEQEIAGLLVCSRTPLSTHDVSRILHVPEVQVVGFLRRASFIHTDASSQSHSMASEAMRNFILRKTEPLRKKLLDALIKDLQANPSVRSSLSALPRYFQDAGRPLDLLEYLTPQRLVEFLEGSDTLDPLNDTLSAGLEAAARLNRDGDSYRFALQKSAIAELGSASSWDSQIEAILALKDYEQAVQMAESMPLAKDKLLLLASVASSQRNSGLNPPDALLERLRRLLDDVAQFLPAEQAIDLAARLFVIMPDRATHLVQQAATNGAPGGTVDRAIAQLTIFAAVTRKADDGLAENEAAIRGQIRDPDLLSFSSTIAHSLSSISAYDALGQARTIENARDRLFFLRHWTNANRHREDSINVTCAALDLVIATTEYSPNARDVLRIAGPLKYCSEEAISIHCVARIDSLLGDLTERGPQAELFRLRILLAATTYRWKPEVGRRRFQEEYFAISEIADLSVKAECLARFASQLAGIDPQKELEGTDGMHSLVVADLRSCVESLLENTAEHDTILTPVIAAIANSHPDEANRIICKANTRNRRDALRVSAIEHLIRGDHSPVAQQVALALAESAESPSSRSECAVTFWREVELRPGVLKNVPLERSLIDAMMEISRPGERGSCAALAYSAIRQAQPTADDKTYDELREVILGSLRKIDDAWEAVDAALAACSLLARTDEQLARSCLVLAQSVQADRLGGKHGPTWLIIAPIKLALASLAGLMLKRSDHSDDAERILLQIALLPSAVLRAQLRAELAMWYYAASRLEDCKRVVQQHLLREIRDLELDSSQLFSDCVVVAADALFVAHQETAKVMFSKLEREHRDQAISRAFNAKLTRLPTGEPYQFDDRRPQKLSREEIDEVFPLLKMVDSDTQLWSFIENLTSAIVGHPKQEFASQQLAVMAAYIKSIATDCLPKADWIRHDGYAILCRAAASRIAGKKLDSSNPVVAESRTVTNASDRALILAQISNWANASSAHRLLSNAADAARQIPVETDKIGRLAIIAEATLHLEKKAGADLVKEVCRLSQSCDHADMDAVRRRLLETAYRVDRELAGTLAEMADTDQARVNARAKRTRQQLVSQLKALDATRAVMDQVGSHDFTPQELEGLPSATWKALASLNAGRVQPKRLEELRPYIRAASKLPLSKAYPILIWILTNLRLKFEATDQAHAVLRPFFDACSLVSEFSTASAFPVHSLRLPDGSGDNGSALIRIGQEKEAEAFLDSWIATNVRKELLVCDPYFKPEDLWVLASVLRHAPEARITILTGNDVRGTSRSRGSVSAPISPEEVFRSAWNQISDQDPPMTDIVICNFADSEQLPLHDRWWISESAGLNLGTSLGGLGKRESKIAFIDADRLADERRMIEDYTHRRIRRSPAGRAVRYLTFSL